MSTPKHMPRPSKRNPFKAGSALARCFDAMLKAYADKARDLITKDGTPVRGSSQACGFWAGYEGRPPTLQPFGSFAYACYRAGQTQRLINDAATGSQA